MAQQQHAADVHPDELCPPNKRYDLMDANKKVDLENVQCPSESKILMNIIKNHPLRFSIAASTSVPWIYMAQKELTLTLDDFRTIFHLPKTNDNNHASFVPPPSFSDMVPFYKQVLGFTMELKTVSNFKIPGLLQPWQTLCKIFSKCLTTRVTGWDQPPLQIMQMLYCFVNNIHVDYAELMWEGIYYSLHHPATSIPYPRFTKIIISHYMTIFPDISRRARDAYHNLQDDDIMKNIFNSGRNKNKVGMRIPPWMITEEMKLTEHYKMYAEVFGLDVPLTHLAEHKSREEQEARENVAQVYEHLAAEEIEKLVEDPKNVDDSSPPRHDDTSIPGTRKDSKNQSTKFLIMPRTSGAYDHEAGSSRTKRSRHVETIEEALLPDVHHEFLEWSGCREAKSCYNTRLAILLPKLIYSPQIMDWQLLQKISCGEEIDNMLKISLKEAESGEEIFFSVAWVRAFNIREPIYPELCREFYATYEFDEVCADDERLGLYHAEELEEEGFDTYFQGGLRSDENFNAREYYERISTDRDLHLSRSSITSVRFPILRLHQNGYANVAWMIAKWIKRKGARSQKDSQICCGQFISKIARKSRVLTKEIVRTLSTPVYCRDLDRTTLRELIDSEDRLIPDILVDDVPRVATQRAPRV
ncbi:hypothetical protein Tco_0256517 [Tanacetum coccineum]